jgi:ketosteroid isomerase-like protein
MRWFESSHPSNALRPAAVIPQYLQVALDAFSARDLERASACFATDGVYREVRREPVRGRAAIAEHFASFAASGVAWQFTFDDVIVAEDRACIVYRFSMAEGEAQPGRERAGCAIVHLDAHGQIAEWREYEG